MAVFQDLHGSIVVVTGAGSGMGRSLAQAFAADGATVIAVDWNEDAARQTAAEIERSGGVCEPYGADVRSRASMQSVFDGLADPARVLVCAAAITSRGPPLAFLSDTEENFDEVMSVNMEGVYCCTQIFARQLVANKTSGSVVLFSSLGVDRPNAGGAAYHASKGGVVGLIRALAVELAPHRIRVNGIAPGYIRTPMTEAAHENPDLAKKAEDRIPLRRWGEPADVADATKFLASQSSDYITGQIITIDGGASVLGAVASRPLAYEV